jgi:hypothetical protein
MKKTFTLFFFFLALIFLFPLITAIHGAFPSYGVKAKKIETAASIWEIHTADLDRDGKAELLLSAFDNRIYVKDGTGKDRWVYDLKGFPSALAVGNLVGSPEPEIIVATQDTDNTVSLLDAQGKQLRSSSMESWVTAACVGDLNGDGRNEILLGDATGTLRVLDPDLRILKTKGIIKGEISALAIAEGNASAGRTLIVGGQETGLSAVDQNLSLIWQRPRKVQAESKGFPFNSTRSVVVEDIDSDGTQEVIVGSGPGMVSVYSPIDGKVIWNRLIENRWCYCQISVGNYVGDSKKEIVALRHFMLGPERRPLPQLVVLDHGGRDIFESDHQGTFYFATSADMDGDAHDEIVLSTPTRDRDMYILDMETGSGNQMRDLVRAEQDDIGKLTEKVSKRRPPFETQTSSSKISVLFEMRQTKTLDVPLLDEHTQFLRKIETSNLEFVVVPVSVGDRKALKANVKVNPYARRYVRTKSQINDERDVRVFVKQFEERRSPFMPLVGQQNWPLFTPERLEQIVQSAPVYCRGFCVYESNLDAEHWPRYLAYLQDVARVCQKHQKKLVMIMHHDFWRRATAQQDFCEALLRPEFKAVLVPMFKSTNMRSPELNIGAILGLWKSGFVDEWGMSVQEDGYLVNDWSVVAPDDVLLRGDVMGAALGAKWFRIEWNSEFLETSSTAAGQTVRYAPNADRHRGLFYDLIRKNLIRLPESKDQVILSPIALQPLQSKPVQGVIDYRAKMQSTAADHVLRQLYHMDRYADGFFPKTPYGYVTSLPYFLDAQKTVVFKQVLRTDGAVFPKQLIPQLPQWGQEMPFEADGVCLLINQFQDEYRVYLLSPDLTNPKEIRTQIHIHLPGTDFRARDLIRNEDLPVSNKSIAVTVPGGTFQIVEIKRVAK